MQELWKLAINKNPVMTISQKNVFQTSSSIWKHFPHNIAKDADARPTHTNQLRSEDRKWSDLGVQEIEEVPRKFFYMFGIQKSMKLPAGTGSPPSYSLYFFLSCKWKRRRLHCKSFSIKLHNTQSEITITFDKPF